jgi:hypothetical protein
MTATRPLAYGYLRLPSNADVDIDRAYVDEARAQLAAVAQREGLALAAVYCETRVSDQGVFYAMVECMRRGQAVAVIAPHMAHLNQIPALAGADRRSASRYLRAAVLTVATDPRVRW